MVLAAPEAVGIDLTLRAVPAGEPVGGRDWWPVVNRLGRAQIEAALESGGFACYDHEPTGELRTALVDALLCGDVDPSAVGGEL